MMVKAKGARTKRRSACPYCGARVRPDRLKPHIRKAHPDGDVSVADSQRMRAWRMEKRRQAAARNAAYVAPVIIITLVVVIYFIYNPIGDNNDGVKPGDKAPDIDPIMDSQDMMHDIEQMHYGHSYLFFEFFSTNCAHCDFMSKPLNWLYANYSDRIMFYSAASEGKDSVEQWKHSHNSPWPHLLDNDDEMYKAFEPEPTRRGVPNFYIIDKDKDGPFIRVHFQGSMHDPSKPVNEDNGEYAYKEMARMLDNVLKIY